MFLFLSEIWSRHNTHLKVISFLSIISLKILCFSLSIYAVRFGSVLLSRPNLSFFSSSSSCLISFYIGYCPTVLHNWWLPTSNFVLLCMNVLLSWRIQFLYFHSCLNIAIVKGVEVGYWEYSIAVFYIGCYI